MEAPESKLHHAQDYVATALQTETEVDNEGQHDRYEWDSSSNQADHTYKAETTNHIVLDGVQEESTVGETQHAYHGDTTPLNGEFTAWRFI